MKDEKYLTASIHCMYYSVLQKMKYVLSKTTDHPISLEQQNSESRGQSSHEYLLKAIRARIHGNIRQERNFVQTFMVLRAKRVEAGYSPKCFTLDECLNSMNDANSLLSKLNYFFGNL